jgi:hypothetical protein
MPQRVSSAKLWSRAGRLDVRLAAAAPAVVVYEEASQRAEWANPLEKFPSP